MAYLVTGGTGLIGSRIVRDVVREGGEAVVLDMFPNPSIFESLLSETEMKRVKIIQGDVEDVLGLVRIIKDNNVDVIFHMAAMIGDAVDANPPLGMKTNCVGTTNIFEAARILGVKKVVWASSITVFGPPDLYKEEYIPNDALHYPLNMYGATKSLCEKVASWYYDAHGVDINAIRFSLVYGPGHARGHGATLTRELIMNPALGKPAHVYFADNYTGWLYVDDAAKAAVLASKAVNTKTRAYSLMGDVRTVRETAAYVKKLLPAADIKLEAGYLGLKWKYASPIEEELGYRPEWPMERGVKEMINGIRRQHGLAPV
jgi:UDP-glucose 4-epimerase